MILAGDVGGTKVHLALYEFTDGNLKHIRDHQYPGQGIFRPGRDRERVHCQRKGDLGVLRRARPGARRAAAAYQSALDAGQPRAGEGSQDRLRLPDQRSAGQRIRYCRAHR